MESCLSGQFITNNSYISNWRRSVLDGIPDLLQQVWVTEAVGNLTITLLNTTLRAIAKAGGGGEEGFSRDLGCRTKWNIEARERRPRVSSVDHH